MPTIKGRFTDPASGAVSYKAIAVDEFGNIQVRLTAVGVMLDMYATAADLPSPTVDFEGQLRYVREAGATHATVRICMRVVAGGYAWVTIGTGP